MSENTTRGLTLDVPPGYDDVPITTREGTWLAMNCLGTVRFAAGDILFGPGDMLTEAYCILSGEIVCLVDSGGREMQLPDYSKNTPFVGEDLLLTNLPSPMWAVVRTPGMAFTYDRPALVRCMNGNPAVLDTVTTGLSIKVRGTLQHLYHSIFSSLTSRIAMILVTSAYRNKTLTLKIAQNEIAIQTAANRVSVSRALRQMQRRDLIRVEKGTIKIVDYDRLKSIGFVFDSWAKSPASRGPA